MAKRYPVSEVAETISEGIIDTFSWVFTQKDEAEKLRKALIMAMSRRGVSDNFNISVFAAVKNDLQTIAHIVLVEPK